MEPPVYSHLVRSTGDNPGLCLASEVGKQMAVGLNPFLQDLTLSPGTYCQIELNCRTWSWGQRITETCAEKIRTLELESRVTEAQEGHGEKQSEN